MVDTRFKVATLVLALISPLFCIADDRISDPMRPPATAAAASAGAPQWNVSGILVSQGRRLAMVNNRLLGVGDRVDGARIKAIHANAVVLDIDGRAVTVNAVSESIRKINKE